MTTIRENNFIQIENAKLQKEVLLLQKGNITDAKGKTYRLQPVQIVFSELWKCRKQI